MARNSLQSATISNCPSGFHNLWLGAQWKWWDEESGEETFLGMKLHRRKQKSEIGNYLRTSASLLHTPVPIKRPQTCLFFWWRDDGERFISVAWQSCHKTTLLQVGFRGLHSWLLKDIGRCPEQSWIPRTPSIIFRSGEDFLGRRVKLILATKKQKFSHLRLTKQRPWWPGRLRTYRHGLMWLQSLNSQNLEITNCSTAKTYLPREGGLNFSSSVLGEFHLKRMMNVSALKG